mgnify:CR=1 FL=1
MIISGAYGRDYKSKKDILTAWNAKKDFVMRDMFYDGQYINKADAEKTPETHSLEVRYKADRNVTVINFRKGKWS